MADQVSRIRQFSGTLRYVIAGIAIAMCVYSIFVVAHGPVYIGWAWSTYIPHRAVHLAFGVLLIFLLVPASKGAPRNKIPWYDILLLIMGLAPCVYRVLFADEIVSHLGTIPPIDIIMAMMLLVVVIEITRRLIGWAMAGLALFLLLYCFLGSNFPGFLETKSFSLARVTSLMYIWPDGIWGLPLAVSATIIIVFIIFAQFLVVSGAGEFFINLAYALLGHIRGGPAKVAILASCLMGMLSGSAIANISSTGIFTIPLMKRVGYKPYQAGAIEACASTGGMIMPPVMGAAAFIIAEWLGIAYWTVCLAAFVPAILYFIGIFIFTDIEAVKSGFKGIPRSELPSISKTLKNGWQYLIPPILLVFLLAGPGYSATYAGLYAIAATFLVSFIRKESRMTPRKIVAAFQGAAITMMDVIAACAACGIIIGALMTTGLAFKLAGGLVAVSGGNAILLLLLCALVSYVLGMGVSPTACYITLALFVAPALIELGIAPLAAHLFIFYFGIIGMITPPVCIGAFIGASIAGAPPFKTGFESMRLAIPVYLIAFAFALDPALILQGPTSHVAVSVITALLGVTLLCFGVSGFTYIKSAALWERILLVLCGIGMIYPDWQTDIICFVIAAGIIFMQILRVRGEKRMQL